MAYPLTIVRCEDCDARFVLEPAALIEDLLLEAVRLLCRHSRDGAGHGEDNFPA